MFPRLALVLSFASTVAGAQTWPINQLFTWSESGPVTFTTVPLPDGGTAATPGSTECVRVFATGETTWANTYLCTPYGLGMQWSATGPLAGSNCLSWREGNDPFWTSASTFLCFASPAVPISRTGFYAAPGPFGPSECLPIRNTLEPSLHGWDDNSFCTTFHTDVRSAVCLNCASPASANQIDLELSGFFFGPPTTTPVVTWGGAPCALDLDGGVSTHTATRVVCHFTPGSVDQGLNLPVAVTNSGISGSTVGLSYPAPVIEAISRPTPATTAGGWLVTLNGRHFGSSPLIIIDGSLCTPQGISTRSQVRCLMAPGEGSVNATIMAGGQSSNAFPVPYDPPVITSASFDGTTGLLTVQGSSFGTTSTITIGAFTCTPSTRTHSLLQCSVPQTVSGVRSVMVRVQAQLSNAATVDFDHCPADPLKSTPGLCGCGTDESADGGCGNACTGNGDCQAGRFCADGVCCDSTCAGGTSDCLACSRAAGAPVNGRCVALQGVACSDGDACTQSDLCMAGMCTGGSPVVCQASGECLLSGVCNQASGVCSDSAKPDGTNCSLGFCASGSCVPRPCAAIPCFLGVACTDVPGPTPQFACGACPAGFLGDGQTCVPVLVDAGLDAGSEDAGAFDAGASTDAGAIADAGVTDAGPSDAGAMEPDAGAMLADAGSTIDGGLPDAGNGEPTVPTGCGCTSGADAPLALAFAAMLLRRRRRRDERA